MNHQDDTLHTYPKAQFPGKIVIVAKDGDIAEALALLKDQKLIGFDTETKPSFKKGEFYHISLLQLASDDYALLFRLQFLKDFSLIKEFFEDQSILKAGVAIRDDIKGLQKIFPFNPQGFIELSDIAKLKKMKNFGLKGMAEESLSLTLSKKAKLSNWESHELRLDQLQYAATDAWIGKRLYQCLVD